MHVSRGDSDICINLMSLSEGKNNGHLRKQADIVQRLFFPLITHNIGLGLQIKHCYTDNQRFDISVTERLFSLEGKCAQEMEFHPLLNG